MTDHAPAYPAAGPAPERDVPPGPGVVPPFPAPPTEGRSARLWLGLGAGALIAVLFCGGGAAAVIGLIVSSTAAFSERIDASVGGYFRAVQERRYDDAYGLLCEDRQDAETPAEFAARVGAEEPIRTFDIGELPLSASELMVPVNVVYGDGRAASLDVNLSQDQTTGDLEVCGIEE